MQNVEQTISEDLYIGDYLEEDVKVFGADGWGNHWMLNRLKKAENKERIFNWPAFFIGSLWFAYQGMLKQAIIVDVIEWLIRFTSDIIVVFWDIKGMILAIILGFLFRFLIGYLAIPCYWKYVQKRLDERKLKRRIPVECSELSQSLMKEGETSIKRAVLYFIIRELTVACVSDVVTTIVWSLY